MLGCYFEETWRRDHRFLYENSYGTTSKTLGSQEAFFQKQLFSQYFLGRNHALFKKAEFRELQMALSFQKVFTISLFSVIHEKLQKT